MTTCVITTPHDDVKGHVWEIKIRRIYKSNLDNFFDTETSVFKLETRQANTYGTFQSHYMWCKD